MTNRSILIIGAIGFIFTSCIEHEIIPAPTPEVDLDAHFIGDINGSDTEYTQNVLGYTNVSTKATFNFPPPAQSSAVYYSEILSTDVNPSIKVGLGSVLFDSGISTDPTLSLFTTFFDNNDLPAYSNDGTTGFEVTYTDQNNREWKSSDASVNPQNVQFTGIKQESDDSGDYSKFICNFDCYVYSVNPDSLALVPPVAHVDSFLIDNATYTGWFKR